MLIPYGSPATFGWTPVGTAIYGLAQTKSGGVIVGRFRDGYGFEKISHTAIDRVLRALTTTQLTHVVAWTMDWEGHRFFLLTVEDDFTLVYDESTGFWTHWDTYTAGVSTAWVGLGHMSITGTQIVGSRVNGQLYACADTYLDDAGAVIRCVRRSPCAHAQSLRVGHNAIYFDFEVGVGIAGVAAPVARVRWSDDAGNTWSDEREVALGAMGEYDHDAIVRRLGATKRKGRVYELVVTDSVVRALSGVYLDVGAAA